jgi:hypothetical protein
MVILVRKVRLNFVFVMHKKRTAGNVGKKGKKGWIEFCICLSQIRTAGNVGKKGKKGSIWLAQLLMSFNKGGLVMLVSDVRMVRLHFVFALHQLRTAGNFGKQGKKGNIDFWICHSQIKASW